MQSDKVDLEPKEAEQQNQLDKYLWLGFPAIFLIWLGYCWFGYRLYPDDLGADRSFDRVNALFSGLAFWGVIWAILLQKRELSFQRRELQLTRQEVRGQKDQLEAQNLTLNQQRFQNTFFSLLEFCENITRSEETTVMALATPVHLKGRECFIEYYKVFQREYTQVKNKQTEFSNQELCEAAFLKFIQKTGVDFRHYFGAFHNLVEFVADSEIELKDFYINIARAQLSSCQMAMLFYSSLSRNGSPLCKPLIERVHLFRDLPHEILVDQSHTKLYNASAF